MSDGDPTTAAAPDGSIGDRHRVRTDHPHEHPLALRHRHRHRANA